MNVYFYMGSKQIEEVKQFIETFYSNKIKVVENKNDADVCVRESTKLTVSGNSFFEEKINSNNDTIDLVESVLSFFCRKNLIKNRIATLHTSLYLESLTGKTILEESNSTEFFLLEQRWDKEYTGHDLDTILYKREVNRTLSTMSKEQRLRYSPRCKSLKKLLERL